MFHNFLHLPTLFCLQLFSIFHGLSRALVLLCKAGIVHRDIKAVNAVLFRDGHVKFIDFGSAIVISGTEEKGVPYAHRPGPPEADMMRMNFY
ncbi:MAG: protein kinase [Gemmatimonadales bacterium]|nr:protein kinase [Gemmatimonadales bacterium]